MDIERWRFGVLHVVIIAAVLSLGELAATRRWIDPTFFGQPSGVAKFLWQHLATWLSDVVVGSRKDYGDADIDISR